MPEPTNDAGTIQALLERLEKLHLPRALAIKEARGRGRVVDRFRPPVPEAGDRGCAAVQTLVTNHPEYQKLAGQLDEPVRRNHAQSAGERKSKRPTRRDDEKSDARMAADYRREWMQRRRRRRTDDRRGRHSEGDGVCDRRRVADPSRALYRFRADDHLCGARHVAAAVASARRRRSQSSPRPSSARSFPNGDPARCCDATAMLTAMVGGVLVAGLRVAAWLRREFHLGAGAGRLQGRHRGRDHRRPDCRRSSASTSPRERSCTTWLDRRRASRICPSRRWLSASATIARPERSSSISGRVGRRR